MRKSVSIESRLASGKCLKLSQEGDDVFQSREVWARGLSGFGPSNFQNKKKSVCSSNPLSRFVLVVLDGVWYPGALQLTVVTVVLEGT